MTRKEQEARTVAIKTELQSKGYTKDAVIVYCCLCHKPAVCKWSRNNTPGINFGRPMIELPEDWKVILTYGSTKQDVLCDKCDYNELTAGRLPA